MGWLRSRHVAKIVELIALKIVGSLILKLARSLSKASSPGVSNLNSVVSADRSVSAVEKVKVKVWWSVATFQSLGMYG